MIVRKSNVYLVDAKSGRVAWIMVMVMVMVLNSSSADPLESKVSTLHYLTLSRGCGDVSLDSENALRFWNDVPDKKPRNNPRIKLHRPLSDFSWARRGVRL